MDNDNRWKNTLIKIQSCVTLLQKEQEDFRDRLRCNHRLGFGAD